MWTNYQKIIVIETRKEQSTNTVRKNKQQGKKKGKEMELFDHLISSHHIILHLIVFHFSVGICTHVMIFVFSLFFSFLLNWDIILIQEFKESTQHFA